METTPVKPVVTNSVNEDGVGWIVFDDPARRANVFNADVQTALGAALTTLETQGARAVVVISAKDRIFVAGADLNWIAQLENPAAAADFARAGQRLVQRLAAARVPVVCAIHGACAGGGYEMALACHWRIATDAPVTQIGLPETAIGTIPGWGGSVRLPRLIGARAALDHILKGQLLPAAEALKAGLVDELVPPEELRARAEAAALRLAAGGVPARPAPAPVDEAFFGELRQRTLARTRGQLPAPIAAIDTVAQGGALDLEAALDIEARAFGAVTAGAECKNLIRIFFLRDAAKKRTLEGWFPAGPPPPAPPRRIGVVGAGVMGSGIAHWLASRGFTVAMRDVQPGLVTRGLTVIRGLFDEAVARNKLSAAEAAAGLARISTTTAWEGFADCDLVIEAIVEDVAAKQKLFTELAGMVRPDTLLASNTSALPIDEIAGHVPDPARTLGLHFFNPVSRMPLVELILGRATSAGAAERALGLLKTLGKSPVICRSSPGFLVTRVLFFYLNEAVRLWEQGVPAAAIDAALRDFGWPMGPLRLIDEVGVDVTDFIFGEMAHYFAPRFESTHACAALLAAGLRGRKNGAGSGFYTYAAGKEALNPAAVARAGGHGGEKLSPAAITGRLMDVMSHEARRCLDEGVVRTPDDVDFALLAGAGFPAFRGGLLGSTRQQPA